MSISNITVPYHIVVSEVEKSIKIQEGEAERKPLLRDGMSLVHLLLSSVAWVLLTNQKLSLFSVQAWPVDQRRNRFSASSDLQLSFLISTTFVSEVAKTIKEERTTYAKKHSTLTLNGLSLVCSSNMTKNDY